jgi:hypothetical protein
MPETNIPFADRGFRYQVKGITDIDQHIFQAQMADQSRVAGEQIDWTDTNKSFKTSGNLTVYGDIITNSASETNIAIGVNTGDNMDVQGGADNGRYNVFLGYQAGFLNSTGYQNIFLGYTAGYTNKTGIENVAIGYEALYANTNNYNVAIGHKASKANTTGFYNIAIGAWAAFDNTGGISNVAVGFEALRTATSSNNVALGYRALYSSTGDNNIGLGYDAGYAITSGANNVAIGHNALETNTKGSGNVAVGEGTLANFNETSEVYTYNVAVGRSSLKSTTTGKENTSIGGLAGYSNTTGDGNISLGYRAGFNETGSNTLYVDNSDTATPLIYGEFDNDILIFNANYARIEGDLTLKEITTPTAIANYGKLYTKTDNKVYFQDGAGNEHEIAFA